MHLERNIWLLGAVAASLTAAGCGNEAPSGDLGQISVAVAAAPAGVGCARVSVAGSTRTTVRTIDITPGVATSVTLSGLPTGMVSVTADAFAETCAALTATSTATWSSDPVSLTLTPGVAVPIQLVMRQNGRILLSIDWDTGGAAAETCSGCARLSVPLTMTGQSDTFGIDFSGNPSNLSGATITARICAFSAQSGSVDLFALDSASRFIEDFRLLPNVTRCDAGFQTLSITLPANGVDFTQTFSVGFIIASLDTPPWANPTVIHVDSLTIATPTATSAFTFDTGPTPLGILSADPGSTITWLGP
jgi:hypothetical protein